MEETTVRNMVFTVPVWKYKVSDWQEKKKALLDIFNQQDLRQCENVWTSRNDLDIDFLYEDIHTFFGEYYEEVGTSFQYFGITGCWFQKYGLANDHALHHHGSFGFSSCLYVDYDRDVHQPTTFLSSNSDPLTGNLMHFRPEVEEGDIIFFPSSTIHYAPPNTSDKTRIILSMNIEPFNEEMK